MRFRWTTGGGCTRVYTYSSVWAADDIRTGATKQAPSVITGLRQPDGSATTYRYSLLAPGGPEQSVKLESFRVAERFTIVQHLADRPPLQRLADQRAVPHVAEVAAGRDGSPADLSVGPVLRRPGSAREDCPSARPGPHPGKLPRSRHNATNWTTSTHIHATSGKPLEQA